MLTYEFDVIKDIKLLGRTNRNSHQDQLGFNKLKHRTHSPNSILKSYRTNLDKVFYISLRSPQIKAFNVACLQYFVIPLCDFGLLFPEQQHAPQIHLRIPSLVLESLACEISYVLICVVTNVCRAAKTPRSRIPIGNLSVVKSNLRSCFCNTSPANLVAMRTNLFYYEQVLDHVIIICTFAFIVGILNTTSHYLEF